MIRKHRFNAILHAVALAALASGGMTFSATAAADDSPPPATAPGTDGANGRHHNPAWAACKKQADDQKLQPGDARRDFMRNCVKSAPSQAPAPATS